MDTDAQNRRLTDLQAKWLEAEQRDIDEAVRALLQHSQGRKFMWWLLQVGKFGTQPFAANALTTSFNCGELNVGQQIADRILSVDPAGFVRMQQEKADESNSRNEQARRTAEPDRTETSGE